MENLTLIIFLLTYTGIIFTRIPGVNIDRPSAAFAGAVLMIITGILPLNEAVSAIDFNTIGLLLGMMIIIAVLELDGFFTFIAEKTIAYSSTRKGLLLNIILVTGFASAFLVNDAVVLLFTPVVIAVCRSAKINPLPYLIGEILASNTGSAMSITGNPQNMLIGIASGISYGRFLLILLPVSVIGMLSIYWLIILIDKREFRQTEKLVFQEQSQGYNFTSMKFSVPIFAAVILLFFLSKPIGLSYPEIALLGSAAILLFGKIKPSKIIKEVDWVLLLFFASLFIVIHAVEKENLLVIFTDGVKLQNDFNGIAILHSLSLMLSQIVSNVPFTILILPLMKASGAGEMLWIALASAATIAGNLTLIGAMANLIVAEIALRYGIEIKFGEFLKYGIPATITGFIISMGVIWLEHLTGIL
ncbi:MAG: putative transporter [Ignavibacteriaceae bacterium]|nr:putative transporter [Ignavibacteriaceae bacterium]